MAGKPKKMGSASKRVATNVRIIRMHKGLSLAALSRRLTDLGQRPILETGLLKLEKGVRGINVDDLVALAEALEVTPDALLTAEWKLTQVTPPQ